MSLEQVKLGEVEVWCEQAGSGPEVLLLHAGGADASMWDDQWDRLTKRFRVARCDLPASGWSPRPSSPFSFSDLLAGLLQHLQMRRPALVGVSLGASIALDFAIDHPEQVGGLLLGAPGNLRSVTPVEPDRREMELITALVQHDRDRAVELFLDIWVSMGATERLRASVERNIGVFWLYLLKLVRFPAWTQAERAGEVTVPTLVTWGLCDSPGTRTVGAALCELIPHAQRVVFTDADHFLPIRVPNGFTDLVVGFVERAPFVEQTAGSGLC